jgi:predicted glutamine amidotransferase
MCRMFGYVGDSREDLERLFDGLRKSAELDTVARDLGMKEYVHNNGWGFALYSDSGLSFYKSERPVFEDEKAIPETSGRIHAIFHARLATDKSMVDSRFSHPYFGDDESSFVFFAHNGALEKERLRKRVGFSGRTTDSELALKFLLKKGLRATGKLEEYTAPNSALNLLIMTVGRSDGAKVYVKQYYNKAEGKKDKSRYYAIYHQELSGGKAAFSSTFNDYGFSGALLTQTGLKSLGAM